MSRGPYVLVVDDSPDGREMLTEYLRFRGLDVIASSNAVDALEQAFAWPPAVVLMDLRMPGMTGWQATERLKAHAATKDVVVIALSAHAFAAEKATARQAGCDAFFPKPFDISQIGNVVEAVLLRGRAGLVAEPDGREVATDRRRPTVNAKDSA